jgi:hypothetical protein
MIAEEIEYDQNNASLPTSPTAAVKVVVFKLLCVGSKIPIRSTPSIQGEILRFVHSGEQIEVYKKSISGFYRLTRDMVIYCMYKRHHSIKFLILLNLGLHKQGH